MLVGIDVRFVVAQSETVISLILVAVSVDLVQRSVLRREVRDGAGVWAWWGFLLLWPALMQSLNRQDTFAGYIGDLVDYQARGAEGFWGTLLICLYFALRRGVERRTHEITPSDETSLPTTVARSGSSARGSPGSHGSDVRPHPPVPVALVGLEPGHELRRAHGVRTRSAPQSPPRSAVVLPGRL